MENTTGSVDQAPWFKIGHNCCYKCTTIFALSYPAIVEVYNNTCGYPFKNIFDFTTAGDWDCVAAVERLPALHYSVDFISLSFGIMGFIVEL